MAPASDEGVLTAPSPRVASRDVDLRLARLHLRLGSVDLARAELEAAQADAPLPADSLTDLAEARWRGGDLAGAGEAARLAIAGGSTSAVAAVIRVEAEVPGTHARAPAGDLPVAGLTPADVDRIFAGLPRSAAWPPDSAQPDPAGPGAEAAAPARARVASARVSDTAFGRAASTPAGRMPLGSTPATSSDEPSAELDAAADDLAGGVEDAAAIRLAVLIRAQPSTAPAVLELLEGATSPALLIVRGDALRLLGRGAEAERSWASASASLGTVPEGGRPAPASAASPAVEALKDPMVVAPPPASEPPPASAPAPASAPPPDASRLAAESGSGEPTGSGRSARAARRSAAIEAGAPAAPDRDLPRPLDPDPSLEDSS